MLRSLSWARLKRTGEIELPANGRLTHCSVFELPEVMHDMDGRIGILMAVAHVRPIGITETEL